MGDSWLLKQEEQVIRFNQGIVVIRHFVAHLAALSDEKLLDLLGMANAAPITNADGRSLLRLTRNGTWRKLSQLVQLNLLERRKQVYRASPYARTLVEAFQLLFRSVLVGKLPQPVANPAMPEVFQFAAEGVESLFSRGKIDEPTYHAKLKLVKQVESELNGI